MSASKIKNLILLILLLGVLGLLPAVVPTQAARTGAERNVHEKLEALYSSYGLTLDASGLPSSQTLYAIEIENPDVSNAAQALLGSKYTAGETAARWLASCTSELGLRCRLSRAGELTARLTGATQAHDLARATRRYLRSMDFAVASVSEPLRESAGVYSVTAVQSLCGVPVFESALTFTYRNSALSRVDGTFYPTGETVRVSESACISCADALVCLLSSRDSLGWVGSEILSCEQGYVHSETASRRDALCAGLADRNRRGHVPCQRYYARGTSAGVVRARTSVSKFLKIYEEFCSRIVIFPLHCRAPVVFLWGAQVKFPCKWMNWHRNF